jgi:hypothetical protein
MDSKLIVDAVNHRKFGRNYWGHLSRQNRIIIDTNPKLRLQIPNSFQISHSKSKPVTCSPFQSIPKYLLKQFYFSRWADFAIFISGSLFSSWAEFVVFISSPLPSSLLFSFCFLLLLFFIFFWKPRDIINQEKLQFDMSFWSTSDIHKGKLSVQLLLGSNLAQFARVWAAVLPVRLTHSMLNLGLCSIKRLQRRAMRPQ